MALTWSTLQQALITWARTALGGSVPVIWADQAVPAAPPAKPYCTLRLITRDQTEGQAGNDEWQTTAAAPGVVRFAHHRWHTLSINVYANDTHGNGHAAALLGAVVRSLNLDAQRLALRQAGAKLSALGSVRDLTTALAGRNESRAQCDLRLATVDVSTEDQSWIETVDTSGVVVANS